MVKKTCNKNNYLYGESPKILGPESESGPSIASCGILANSNGLIAFTKKYYSNDLENSLFKTNAAKEWRDTPIYDENEDNFSHSEAQQFLARKDGAAKEIYEELSKE